MKKKVSSLEASQTYFYSLALFFFKLALKNMYLSVHTIFFFQPKRINFLASLFLLFNVSLIRPEILGWIHSSSCYTCYFFLFGSFWLYHTQILVYLNSALPFRLFWVNFCVHWNSFMIINADSYFIRKNLNESSVWNALYCNKFTFSTSYTFTLIFFRFWIENALFSLFMASKNALFSLLLRLILSKFFSLQKFHKF